MADRTFLPQINNAGQDQPSPISWDPRLNARGTVLTEYQPRPGTTWYKLVHAEWRDVEQSRGLHHILVDVLDEWGVRLTGVPVRFVNGGEFIAFTEPKPGEEAAVSFGMFAVGCAYSVEVAYASDRVGCLGLGTIDDPDHALHTSYYFVFQRTTQGPQDG